MIYIAHIRFPTEKAHGIQIAKTCAALLARGVPLELWVTDRKTPIAEEPARYYGLSSALPIMRIATMDAVSFGRFGFLLSAFSFARACARLLRERGREIVYCRDEAVLWALSYLSAAPFIWESHDGSWNFMARRAALRARAIVVVTEGAKALYVARGVPQEKVRVIRNGIELSAYAKTEDRERARARLGVRRDIRVALYAGRLDGWKGTDTLLSAASLLPEDVCIAVIGGEPAQIEAGKRAYPKVIFLGYRPYAELADNLSAADVLVLPNTAHSAISLDLTSPLKLMAYMAKGLPIVASDIPSVRELLDEESAYFAKPDDAQALAAAIMEALSDPGAPARAAKAQERARSLDWSERARAIESLIAAL